MSRDKSGPAADWREGRRLRAWELHQDGWTNQEIAEALGVSAGAVSQWLTRGRAGGVEALRHRPPPGPPRRLTDAQLAALPRQLAYGAETFGFRGEVWTLPRIAAMIEREFGVRYHPAHVSRLLRQIGWSVQKPVTRASQRDEEAIRIWVEERWPAVKKKAEVEARTLVWVDESAFYPLPMVVRTWAPCGETPVLPAWLTRDHLSVISGITPAGQLLMQVQERALQGPDVVRFLRHLLRHIPGKLLVIWDGGPIHRAQPVREFLTQGGAARMHLEQLPAYAPELNPDEGIWNYLKRVELRNVCCDDLPELRLELQLATKRLRHKRSVLQACIEQCGYAV